MEKDTEVKESGETEEDQIVKPEGKPDKSPLKLTKKMKTVMCHVTLLDGTQFPCEVEVRDDSSFQQKPCENGSGLTGDSVPMF